jgi:lysophospholipase L1-like esterase
MKKTLFIGDSLIEGRPGASIVDAYQKSFQNEEVINAGKGGDTVLSILKRVKKSVDFKDIDQIVLLVGVNDVFSRLNLRHRLLKILLNQIWTTNLSHFERRYQELLNYLLEQCSNIIVISPILMGEDINNKWNTELEKYVDVIKEICQKMNIEFVNMRTILIEELKGKKQSDYLPYQLQSILNDTKLDMEEVTRVSEERGLFFTLDGVHLNQFGVNLVLNEIKNVKKA